MRRGREHGRAVRRGFTASAGRHAEFISDRAECGRESEIAAASALPSVCYEIREPIPLRVSRPEKIQERIEFEEQEREKKETEEEKTETRESNERGGED